jgi:hypothetical protein
METPDPSVCRSEIRKSTRSNIDHDNHAFTAGIFAGCYGIDGSRSGSIERPGAITAIYEGRREFGLDLLRRNLELSYLKWGYLWDGTCACRDTGEVNYGWDYWFNWSIWTAPAALRNQDVSALMKPGGLVRKVLDAGKPV